MGEVDEEARAADLDALAAAGVPLRLFEGDRDVTDLFTRTDGPGRTITFHLGEMPAGRTVTVWGRSLREGGELTLRPGIVEGSPTGARVEWRDEGRDVRLFNTADEQVWPRDDR